MRFFTPQRLATVYLAALVFAVAGPANAAPWAEPGDSALRSDVELLANAGVVDGITTQWPLPWGGMLHSFDGAKLANQPDYVRDAAARVNNERHDALDRSPKYNVTVDVTNEPAVVRGFDGMGRQKGQVQFSSEWIFDSSAIRLSVGARSGFKGDQQNLTFDGTYAAQRIGGTIVYAGYLSHWWGPGWISALSLSNNARPFPHVGFSRSSTTASEWPILNLLGPWQFDFFVGVLDGPRIARNTLYNGARLTVNPLPGLEIGVARTQQLCGKGHACKPIAAITTLQQSVTNINKTNDEGVYDVRYSNQIAGIPFSLYSQIMFEDMGRPAPIGVSHLFGGTVWVPIEGERVRITLEYASTVPAYNFLEFGSPLHGFAYNNGDYFDGMRYRGRTLGMSLDSDSELTTLQAAWTDAKQRSYSLTLHHAKVSSPYNMAPFAFPGPSGNVVTTSPVLINVVEARATLPFNTMKLDLAARLQDDQPRPSSGFTGSVEASLRIEL